MLPAQIGICQGWLNQRLEKEQCNIHCLSGLLAFTLAGFITLYQTLKEPAEQGGIIKYASWELAAFYKYFTGVSVNYRVSKQSYSTQLTRSVHNMTTNCLQLALRAPSEFDVG